ncbi:hypothetical protein A5884_003764, partial [Enterococcus sp. 7D2_DIV0200]
MLKNSCQINIAYIFQLIFKFSTVIKHRYCTIYHVFRRIFTIFRYQ